MEHTKAYQEFKKNGNTKFVRYSEGAEMYHMSVSKVVVETKAADGYILDETAHDVTLRYDDNAPDVVVATLKLVNVPTEPKLPQTGYNANPLL